MKVRLLVVLSSLIFSSQAFSGLLIDPYLGIGRSAFAIEGVVLADPDAESSSSIGSRLGYSFLLVSAGIDYEMVTAGDFKVTNTSAFVGVDLPILLRFWGEVMLSSNLDDDSSTTYDFKDGYSVGVGFTGLPFVSLNLELSTLNYEFTFLNNDADFSVASTTFSVSLPLDF